MYIYIHRHICMYVLHQKIGSCDVIHLHMQHLLIRMQPFFKKRSCEINIV